MLNFATASNTNLSKYKSLKAKFFFKKNFSNFLAISSGAKDCTQQLWVYRQHFANLSEACGDRLCGSAHFIHSGAKLMRNDSVWPKGSRALQINASLLIANQYLQGNQRKMVTQIPPVLKASREPNPLQNLNEPYFAKLYVPENYFIERKTNIWRCSGRWWVKKSLISLPTVTSLSNLAEIGLFAIEYIILNKFNLTYFFNQSKQLELFYRYKFIKSFLTGSLLL